MNIESTIKNWRWWVMLPVMFLAAILLSPQIVINIMIAILTILDEILERVYEHIPASKINRWVHRD